MEPQVLVVTGGGRGIGAAIARRAASTGWTVCLSYRTDADSATAVAAEIGGRAVQADVATEADVVALFAAADEVGPLHGLVNNAGIVGVKARVDELTPARIQRLLAVNVLGSFLCAREAVRRMSTAHGGAGGAIVNVSSIGARLGSPGEYVDYAASKAAVDTLTLGLAKEVASEAVRVNAVRPGIIDTDIHASGGQPDRVVRLGPSVPMGRAGTVDEIAAAVVWLLSEEASYCTGALLDIGGGR